MEVVAQAQFLIDLLCFCVGETYLPILDLVGGCTLEGPNLPLLRF